MKLVVLLDPSVLPVAFLSAGARLSAEIVLGESEKLVACLLKVEGVEDIALENRIVGSEAPKLDEVTLSYLITSRKKMTSPLFYFLQVTENSMTFTITRERAQYTIQSTHYESRHDGEALLRTLMSGRLTVSVDHDDFCNRSFTNDLYLDIQVSDCGLHWYTFAKQAAFYKLRECSYHSGAFGVGLQIGRLICSLLAVRTCTTSSMFLNVYNVGSQMRLPFAPQL
nr:hypothetical protein HmN_000950700 [Hymenolepis microstoma]